MTNDQLGNAVFAQGWLETGVGALSSLPLSDAEIEGFQTYYKVLSDAFDLLLKENAALQQKLNNVQIALLG